MEREKPKSAPPREPAPEVAPRDDVHVAGGLARCPYCHESVAVDAPGWVSCRSCLARHHEDCWKERLACSTCGHKVCLAGAVEYVEVDRPALHVANEKRWVRTAWWVLTVLMIPSCIGMGIVFALDGRLDVTIGVVFALFTWFGYGLGWFGTGPRIRGIEKQRRDA